MTTLTLYVDVTVTIRGIRGFAIMHYINLLLTLTLSEGMKFESILFTNNL